MKLIELTETQYAKLMADKARLDWLEKQGGVAVGHVAHSEYNYYFQHWDDAPPLREAIDCLAGDAFLRRRKVVRVSACPYPSLPRCVSSSSEARGAF